MMWSSYEILEHDDGLGQVFWMKSAWKPRFGRIIGRKQIEALRVSGDGPVDDLELDFIEELPNLRGLEGIFDVEGLQFLNIQNYPYEDLTPLSKMSGLRSLSLTSRKLKSLAGIEGCCNLEHLDLYDCGILEGDSELEVLPALRSIEIESCGQVESRRLNKTW